MREVVEACACVCVCVCVCFTASVRLSVIGGGGYMCLI